MRCLLICDKTTTQPPHVTHAATTAWVELTDVPQALLAAEAQGYTVVGLLTQQQPRTRTGKRVLARGTLGPRGPQEQRLSIDQ